MTGSLSESLKNVDTKIDQASRIKACRAILREAARRCTQIGFGGIVDSVEEIEFADRLESALAEYLRARTDGTAGRAYIGMTAGMDKIAQNLVDHVDAATAAIADS